ncbi:general transcription factor 3C polypeptide 3-like isoform X2 [Gopherus evgoodei]|uniref:general transcription factor 3C polypeptide 3-like isoform X2 n=1 Tax=Gopherus evgoodei TaxID=1825980 RepID=UPI0011D007AC|nr:general transcription factor 3C polypeptide 3-like isoform X2 [Gopherus evgoodei]
MMLCRRDPGEGGIRARWLCGFLSRKQRSQKPSPRAQQEPSTSLATEEPSASPEQELGGSGTGTSSSSVRSDSPEAEGSLCAETPSAQQEWAEEEEEEEEEEEHVSPEQDTIRVIQEHLQGRVKLVAKQLRFLHTVPRLCFSAQQQGLNTLEPHFSKAALVESIAELIENLPVVPEPASIISSSMATFEASGTRTVPSSCPNPGADRVWSRESQIFSGLDYPQLWLFTSPRRGGGNVPLPGWGVLHSTN